MWKNLRLTSSATAYRQPINRLIPAKPITNQP